MGGTGTGADVVESDHGGLFYLVMSLLVLAIYTELLVPVLTDVETLFLKTFARKELNLVVHFPLTLLLIAGLLKLLWVGHAHAPPYYILHWCIMLTGFYNSFPVNYNSGDNREAFNGVRVEIVQKAVVVAYFCFHVSLFLFLFGIFGAFRFDMDRYSTPPKGVLYRVNKNGELIMINMTHGYLTSVLYYLVPDWLLFIIMFYVSYLEATVSFRASWHFIGWLMGRILGAIFGMGDGSFRETGTDEQRERGVRNSN